MSKGKPSKKLTVLESLYFDQSPDPIAICDPSLQFVRVNSAFTEALGWTSEDFSKQSFLVFVHPDERAVVRLATERILNGNPVDRIEHRFMCKSGGFKWIRWTFRLEPKSGYAFGRGIDVTQTLEENNVLNKYGCQVSSGVWKIDIGALEVTGNSIAEKVLQTTKKFPVPLEDFVQNFTPESSAVFENSLQELLREGTPMDVQLEVNTRLGGTTSLRFRGCIDDRESDTRTIVGVIEDVQHSLNLAKENLHSLERMEIALSAAEIGIWDWNLKEESLHWDRQTYRLHGIAEGDSTEPLEAWKELIHPNDRKRLLDTLYDSISDARPWECSYRIVWPNGETRHVRSVSTSVVDHSGNTYRVLGVSWDETDEKVAQAELKSQQSKAIASARFTTIGEMSGGVAHEIRNPAAVIDGYLRRVIRLAGREDTLDLEEIKRVSERSLEMVERIINIMESMRKLSREDESGEELVDKDIEGVLDESLSLISERIKIHGVLLQLPKFYDDLIVSIHPNEMKQAIISLINNSIDALEGVKDPVIKISVESNPDWVSLSIFDNGTGISDDIVDKIMIPFFTTKDVGKGTGMGLSIAKSVVEGMGGSLELDRSVEGTQFIIRLPNSSISLLAA